MNTQEAAKKLLAERAALAERRMKWKDERAVMGGEETAEETAEWERMTAEDVRLSKRLDEFLQLQEDNQALEAQRERIQGLLGSSERQKVEAAKGVDEQIVKWFRAAAGSDEYVPKSIEVKFPDTLQADLTKGVASAGGNLVPVGFAPELFRVMAEVAAIRSTSAKHYTTSSGEDFRVPKLLTTGAAVIVAEATAIPESDPTFGQVVLGAYKYGNLMQVSNELLTDSAIDLAAELGRIAGTQIADGQGPHFATGTGTGQPQGVTNANVLGVQGTTVAAITADQLQDLKFSVRSPYRGRGEWLMNDSTWAAISKLKYSGSGEYLVREGFGEERLSLLGRPVILDPNMPTAGAQAAVILFGDFSSYYAIRDVNGIRFDRSDEFAFDKDLITFRVLMRTDAKQIVNDGAGSAVKALRLT